MYKGNLLKLPWIAVWPWVDCLCSDSGLGFRFRV